MSEKIFDYVAVATVSLYISYDLYKSYTKPGYTGEVTDKRGFITDAEEVLKHYEQIRENATGPTIEKIKQFFRDLLGL